MIKALIKVVGLREKVIIKEDALYEASRMMWNRAIEKYPLAIVYCETNEDIRGCIKWASTYKVEIRIRSGGHHYQGYSTGNDVLVMDVSRMCGITIDEEKSKVTIEAGVRNRELYEVVCGKGYPFPGGGCPTVGVVGFALGGGWGYSARLLGLGCDAIREIEMIDYKGDVLKVSEEQNANLFWALKGSGGGQYGVITKLTFSLPDKREKATLIRIDLQHITRAEQIDAFKWWQEMIQNAPLEINFKISFYHSQERGKGILLLGIYYGEKEEAYELLAPFIKIGHQMQILLETMSVLEVNRWIQNAHPDFEHYQSSGRFVQTLFKEEALHDLLDCIEERSEGSVYTAISGYGMGGSRINNEGHQASFYYRESLYILGFQSVWEDNKDCMANRAWFSERFEKIKGYTVGSFVNFPSNQLKDYHKAYYGKNSGQLKQIKAQYDPLNRFGFEQGL